GKMTTHTGQCHCGAVAYEVAVDIENVMECNCSICRRTGWRLSFVGASQFTLTRGENDLVDYQFGKKHLHHPFCKHCGVRSFSWGPNEQGDKMFAVNTRCLDDFDVGQVEVNQYDGAAI
ncbi:MAG: GFA family protein, partial [Pseudomonadota bacterium]